MSSTETAARRTRDAAARRAAFEEFEAPLVVEAGAGTGKTTTLVGRILVWALGPGWELQAGIDSRRDGDPDPDSLAQATLEGITAITFTEAAAAEMAARVARDLSWVAHGATDRLPGVLVERLPPPEVAAPRARALLGNLDRLRVQTIHAFCRALLARHPLEARLHPDLEVDADGQRVEAIVREVVERAARDAYASADGNPLMSLAALGYGPRKIGDALVELATAAAPAVALERSPFDRAGIDALLTALRHSLGRFLESGGRDLAALAGARAKGPRAVRRADESLAALDRAAAPAVAGLGELIARFRAIWEGRPLDDWLQKWRRGALSGAERRVIGEDRVDGFTSACADLRSMVRHILALDPAFFELARRCLAPLLSAVEREMRARGLATFDALLRDARRLLEDDAETLTRERHDLHQLLVDEFQDTDRQQCRIVRLLALDGAAADRPGLFVVGDPKQTIFGWRDADLEAYAELVDAVEAAGGRRVCLTQNFRSARPILDEVNRAIAPVMVAHKGLQPDYEPLDPSPEHAGDPGFVAPGRAAIEHWILREQDGDGGVADRPAAARAAEIEAAAVAADIADLAPRAGGWGAFAILLRATNRLETFLEALRRRGVPFRVRRDKSYYRRREVIDAAALVRATIQPTDHLALVAWMRSPAIGVPDAAWIPLWRHGFPEAITALDGPDTDRLELLAGIVDAAAAEMPAAGVPGLERVRGWELNLLDALERLAELRRAWHEEAADHFVSRLRHGLLPECTEAARFLGEYRIANLDRFFRHLTLALEESGGDAQAVLRALRRGIAEAREAQEAMPNEAASDAVQVLTIHSAKGLEFDHVYLVQTHSEPGSGSRQAIDLDERRDGDRLELSLWGAPSPGLRAVHERRARVERAERVRTLYVALTRAKRRLVVTGSWPDSWTEKRPLAAASHRDLLFHRWPWGEAALRETLAGGPRTDEHGALWKLASDGERSASAAPAPPAVALPEPSIVRAGAQSLAADRLAAVERQRRPAIRAASAETGQRLAAAFAEELGHGPAGDSDREAALAAGDAVHRVLESWDLTADPANELATGRELALQRLAALSGTVAEEAARRAGELLDRFARGALFERFAELAPHVLARELPLLLPVDRRRYALDDSPLAAWGGAIDLLALDPESGRPLIVDFKTDRVESEEEIERRAGAYAAQETVYRRAVREAFGLDDDPAFELWFLWPDRLWRT